MNDAALIAAAAKVDVIETAGRIIAHPRRHATAASVAQTLALAHAVETFWSIVIDAEVLVRALERCLPLTAGETTHHDTVAIHMAAIRTQLAAIRGDTDTQEK
jgi:hypothetical protein